LPVGSHCLSLIHRHRGESLCRRLSAHEELQSGGAPHACRFDELLRGVVDRTSLSPFTRENIDKLRICVFLHRRWESHGVCHWTLMVGHLEMWVVHAIELPQHLHKICLPTQEMSRCK